MTYPPTGNEPNYDPYAAQQPIQPAYDPYAAQPNPYAQPPATPAYDPATGYGTTSGAPYGTPPGMPAGYGSPYGPAYAMAPVARTNGMSIASMVLGICGILFCACYGFGLLPGAVGAILGHVSMKQIKDRGEQGRGMAIAGIITGWLAVAMVIIGWGLIIYLVMNDPNFQRDFNSNYN